MSESVWVLRFAGRPFTNLRARTGVQVAVLVVWMLAAGLAAGAVGLVLALRRLDAPVPDVYLSNVWSALVLPAVGLLLVSRRAHRLVGWLFAVGGLGVAATSFGKALTGWAVAHGDAEAGWVGFTAWLANWTWNLYGLPLVVLLLLPGGGLRGWRGRLVVLAWAACGVRMVLSALSGYSVVDPRDGSVAAVPNPYAVPAVESLAWPILVVIFVVITVVQVTGLGYQVWRWRRASGQDRSLASVFIVAGLMASLPWGDIPLAGEWLAAATVPLFAVLVAVGLLGHRGSDAELVASRTYLWASLTTCVVAAYVAVVTLLAALVQRAAGASVALAATGFVALLVAPLRVHLQRGVDRLLYGARADPYGSVAALGRRLQGSVSPSEVLPVITRTITEQLRLPFAAFHLTGPDGTVTTVEHGDPCGDLVALRVEYLGQRVGELVVSTPATRVPLRPAEQRLLEDLARQAGPAAHGVATVVQLQQSRQRLVAAREEERRLLRRELHDDMGALLTSAALGVDAASNRLPADSPVAQQLARVRAVVSTAVVDLRRIIDGLRPPALDELGLVGAVRDRLLSMSNGAPQVVLHADALPPLPPEVEVACYYVVTEAVHNAVRHAQARQVIVQLTLDEGRLSLAVRDDGPGITADAGSGQGMTTMRQRVEEIGGRLTVVSGPDGTTVAAVIPGAVRP